MGGSSAAPYFGLVNLSLEDGEEFYFLSRFHKTFYTCFHLDSQFA